MKLPGSLALDSSLIIRHMRTADAEIANTLKMATELYVPLTVLGEILYGIRRSGNDRRAEEAWEKFEYGTVLLHPDDSTAEHYAELKDYVARKGTPIPENDLWIAATARSHDLTLYCHDRHFDGLASMMSILQA